MTASEFCPDCLVHTKKRWLNVQGVDVQGGLCPKCGRISFLGDEAVKLGNYLYSFERDDKDENRTPDVDS